jgi:modification methylase
MTEARIIHGSSIDSPHLAKDLIGKISLVVTSPPYHNAISYTKHASDPNQNYRERYLQDYALEYMEMLNRIWTSSNIMLKRGGYLAINVGSVLDNGIHYPLAEDIASEILRICDLQYVRSIFWHKVTAGVKRAGSVIQHPYPSYWHPNIMTEHILLFRKPGRIREPKGNFPREWLEPVWDLAPVPPRTIDHPAPFPEDLPHRLIRMFTDESDWIMDPFNGAGATTKAAYDLSRNSLGFDIEKKYVDQAKLRIKSKSLVREKQLVIKVTPAKDFIPGPSKGKTRHGAGLAKRK